jgi:hypothetical protein
MKSFLLLVTLPVACLTRPVLLDETVLELILFKLICGRLP